MHTTLSSRCKISYLVVRPGKHFKIMDSTGADLVVDSVEGTTTSQTGDVIKMTSPNTAMTFQIVHLGC